MFIFVALFLCLPCFQLHAMTTVLDSCSIPRKAIDVFCNSSVIIQHSFPLVVKIIPKDSENSYTESTIEEMLQNLHLKKFITITSEPKNYTISSSIDTPNGTTVNFHVTHASIMCQPTFDSYTCFNTFSKDDTTPLLTATYSTSFLPSSRKKDKRYEVIVDSNNANDSKKIFLDKGYMPNAIFLEGYFLLVGAKLESTAINSTKSKYQINMYNVLALEAETPAEPTKPVLTINLQSNHHSAQQRFKIFTTQLHYVIIFDALAKKYLSIPFKIDLEEKVLNVDVDKFVGASESDNLTETKIPNTNPQIKKDSFCDSNYFKPGCCTAIVAIVAILAYNRKKIRSTLSI